MPATPARKQPRSQFLLVIGSRKVFELLNHDLSRELRDVLGVMEFIELNVDGLPRGSRDA
jgi:hypothetical protein